MGIIGSCLIFWVCSVIMVVSVTARKTFELCLSFAILSAILAGNVLMPSWFPGATTEGTCALACLVAVQVVYCVIALWNHIKTHLRQKAAMDRFNKELLKFFMQHS